MTDQPHCVRYFHEADGWCPGGCHATRAQAEAEARLWEADGYRAELVRPDDCMARANHA